MCCYSVKLSVRCIDLQKNLRNLFHFFKFCINSVVSPLIFVVVVSHFNCNSTGHCVKVQRRKKISIECRNCID